MTNKSIYQSLLEFQANMPVIKKTETNPFFKSKYADLSSIQKTIQKDLAKSELGYTQGIRDGVLHTTLFNADGQTLDFTYPLPLEGKPQDIGSAITYAKRYSLVAILGLIIEDEEDDDGNAAQSSTVSTQAKKQYPEDDRPWLTQDNLDGMLIYIEEGKADIVKESMNKYRMKREFREQLNNALNI